MKNFLESCLLFFFPQRVSESYTVHWDKLHLEYDKITDKVITKNLPLKQGWSTKQAALLDFKRLQKDKMCSRIFLVREIQDVVLKDLS